MFDRYFVFAQSDHLRCGGQGGGRVIIHHLRADGGGARQWLLKRSEILAAAAFAALLCIAMSASAEVADLTASGFLIRHEVTVTGTPEAAWKALVDVGAWWNSDHTYSGNSTNLSIDARGA